MDSLEEDITSACVVVDKVYDRASKIAREFNLSIQTNRKIDKKEYWVSVLNLRGEEPEYRVSFNVCLATKVIQPHVAQVDALVTDLKTGQYHQFQRKDVPLHALEFIVNEGLTEFEEYLKANEGLDPIETARKQMGTAYYWEYENDDGYLEYTTDFGESDFNIAWSGLVCGDDGSFEGTLEDGKGILVAELKGEKARPLMLEIEKLYKEKSQK